MDAPGRLGEVEPLELEAEAGGIPGVGRPIDEAAKQSPRTHHRLGRRSDVVAEEEVAPRLPRHATEALEVDGDRAVRVAALPAGVGDVVVALVGRVPAEHHVTEAEPAVDGSQELRLVEVLAAQDAVDVDDGDLHVVGGVGGQRVDHGLVGRGAGASGCRVHDGEV